MKAQNTSVRKGTHNEETRDIRKTQGAPKRNKAVESFLSGQI